MSVFPARPFHLTRRSHCDSESMAQYGMAYRARSTVPHTACRVCFPLPTAVTERMSPPGGERCSPVRLSSARAAALLRATPFPRRACVGGTLPAQRRDRLPPSVAALANERGREGIARAHRRSNKPLDARPTPLTARPPPGSHNHAMLRRAAAATTATRRRSPGVRGGTKRWAVGSPPAGCRANSGSSNSGSNSGSSSSNSGSNSGSGRGGTAMDRAAEPPRVSLALQRQRQRDWQRQQRRIERRAPPRHHPLQRLLPLVRQQEQQQRTNQKQQPQQPIVQQPPPPPPQHATRPGPPASAGQARPDVVVINGLNKELALLQRKLALGGYDKLTPVWLERQPSSVTQPDAGLRVIFARAVAIEARLTKHLQRKLIRPDTKHRHEFSILTERLLRVYSCCGGGGGDGGSAASDAASLARCRHVLGLIRHYGLELSHAQCGAAVHAAAQCGQWTEAAEWYAQHTDPDASGVLPVTNGGAGGGAAHRTTTVAGLYCIARAAASNHDAPPVESVLDGVTNLSLVSPSDGESCTWRNPGRGRDCKEPASRAAGFRATHPVGGLFFSSSLFRL